MDGAILLPSIVRIVDAEEEEEHRDEPDDPRRALEREGCEDQAEVRRARRGELAEEDGRPDVAGDVQGLHRGAEDEGPADVPDSLRGLRRGRREHRIRDRIGCVPRERGRVPDPRNEGQPGAAPTGHARPILWAGRRTARRGLRRGGGRGGGGGGGRGGGWGGGRRGGGTGGGGARGGPVSLHARPRPSVGPHPPRVGL